MIHSIKIPACSFFITFTITRQWSLQPHLHINYTYFDSEALPGLIGVTFCLFIASCFQMFFSVVRFIFCFIVPYFSICISVYIQPFFSIAGSISNCVAPYNWICNFFSFVFISLYTYTCYSLTMLICCSIYITPSSVFILILISFNVLLSLFIYILLFLYYLLLSINPYLSISFCILHYVTFWIHCCVSSLICVSIFFIHLCVTPFMCVYVTFNIFLCQ